MKNSYPFCKELRIKLTRHIESKHASEVRRVTGLSKRERTATFAGLRGEAVTETNKRANSLVCVV